MVGACDISGDIAPVGSSAFARPKSSTFTVPSWRTLDVGWLEIAVDDPLLVRGFERLGDLLRDGKGFINWNRSLRDAVGQVGPSTSSMTRALVLSASSRP